LAVMSVAMFAMAQQCLALVPINCEGCNPCLPSR
jgi:hypothetical protein